MDIRILRAGFVSGDRHSTVTFDFACGGNVFRNWKLRRRKAIEWIEAEDGCEVIPAVEREIIDAVKEKLDSARA